MDNDFKLTVDSGKFPKSETLSITYNEQNESNLRHKRSEVAFGYYYGNKISNPIDAVDTSLLHDTLKSSPFGELF